MIEINNSHSLALWNEKSPACTRDLRIKKIVFTIICLINVAGIVGLLCYITLNYNIPSIEGAYSLTPFIGGVIAALLLLKLPTFGINHLTYRNITNIPLMISEAIALLFFGPILLVRNAIDWSDYADAYEARRIKNDFQRLNFEDTFTKYGSRIDNLEKYGLITTDQAARMREFYQTYKSDLKTYNYLLKKVPEIVLKRELLPQQLRDHLDGARVTWHDFKNGLDLPEPPPQMPQISFFENLSCCSSQERD